MITYIKGDATYPERITPDKYNLIVHIVNNVGGWGAGFVLALSRRWTTPEYHYRANWKMRQLGDIDIIQVDKNISVVNLFGQHGIRPTKTDLLDPSSLLKPSRQTSSQIVQPVRYEAIRIGLRRLRQRLFLYKNATVHMPKIGCGLAGGDWSIVSRIIDEELNDVEVYVYELN